MARKPSPLDPALVRMAMTIVVGAMAVILNTTMVAVALPTLAAQFDVGLDTIQWVTTAYLLAMFAAIPLTGWAQARIGGTRLWMTALAVFTAGSALSATAWSADSLIAFRALQGFGGGIIIPLMATLLMQAAGGKNFGRLMAVVGLPTALGPILGPVVGGLILGYAPWEWLFLVNVPFGIAGIWLAARTFPRGLPHRKVRLDVPGAVLATAGLVAFIYGLSQVAASGGVAHPDVLAPGLTGLALMALFVVYAWRKRSGALLDLHLLRFRNVAVATALMFVVGVTIYGGMFLLPLYYQQLRGASALATGLLLIPQGVGALATRAIAGRLVDTIGPRWVGVAGFAVVAAATLPFTAADAVTDPVYLGAVLFARGLGMGAAFIPLMATAYIGLAHDDIPDASIITRVGQQIGGSTGVALLAVVLSSQLYTAPTIEAAGRAYGHTFWWATIATAIGAVLALALPGREAATGERAQRRRAEALEAKAHEAGVQGVAAH